MSAHRPRVLVTRSPKQSSALADRLRELGADPVLIPTIEIVDPSSFARLDAALAELPTFHWLLFTSANAVEAFASRRLHLQEQNDPRENDPQQRRHEREHQEHGHQEREHQEQGHQEQGHQEHGQPQHGHPQHGQPQHGQQQHGHPQHRHQQHGHPQHGQPARHLPPVISTGAQSAQWRDPCITQESASAKPFVERAFPRIAAIGPATARALAEIGLTPGLLPPQAVAESLAAALLPHARRPDGSPARFLLVRAEQAREHLPETLRAAGAEVTVAPAYRTVIPAAYIGRMQDLFSSLQGQGTDDSVAAVTFTSASTVRNLFTMLEATGCTLPPGVVRASIGPITSSVLNELGYPPHVQAPEATVESLAANLVKYLTCSEVG